MAPPRTKTSVRAVQNTHRKTLCILFWILVIHIAAIAQFTRGFLLTRPVFLDRSTEKPEGQAPFDRAVILIVDALRYDFVQTPANAPDLPYLRHFPVENISQDPRNAFTLKFIADPPTTTLQRLKGLTTGSLPAFIDAGSSFAGFKIEEDNWVMQAAEHLGPVSFVGDDTWEALYSEVFSQNYPYPSFNVRDLDTVDNGVKHYLPQLYQNTSNKVVIGHTLGVDHAGHRYGPSHPAMTRKLEETYEFVEQVAEMIDDRTVLMVFGDHGMDQTGNHGGDSQDELEAALWVYSKRPVFTPSAADGGDTVVRQIDFVPTICGLLGIPVPFNSLGFPIRQAFDAQTWKYISAQTMKQLQHYTAIVNLPSARNAAAAAVAAGKSPAEFQKIMLEVFADAWIQFDVGDMYRGIGLLAASIVVSILLYNSVTAGTAGSILYWQSVGAGLGGIAGVVLSYREFFDSSVPQFLVSVFFYISAGALLFSLSSVIKTPNFSKPSSWSLVAWAFLAIECATSFSNSFVIWESRILQFLLATFYVLLAVKCARTGSPIVTYLGGFYSLILLLVLRVNSGWVVCREETAARCISTFFEPGSSMIPTWTLFAVGILGLVFRYFMERFWTIGKNNVGTASLILNMTPLAFMFIVAYWSLDNAEARGWIARDMPGLQTIKVLLGRVSLTFGAVGGLIIWWRSNVPIEIVFKDNRPKNIEGYNNIHGAYVLLAALCMYWSMAVAHKPPAILAFSGLLYTCMGALDFIDVSALKYTWVVPVVFDMLANAFFYYTGHQATIPSIQWDTAFIAARTVSYPWSPITVTLNSLSTFLLSGIVCVMAAIWRRPPFKDPKQPVHFSLRAALGLATVSAVRTLASIIAACALRRHLMSWKIFAPRFMFGALSLIAMDIACIIGLTFNGHTIKKVTEMFGYN